MTATSPPSNDSVRQRWPRQEPPDQLPPDSDPGLGQMGDQSTLRPADQCRYDAVALPIDGFAE